MCFGVRGRGRGSGGEDSPVDGLVGPWVRGLNKDGGEEEGDRMVR